MVYDCFTFFNELELLEIRLNELNNVVDKFVLVEATRTFQQQAKPLYFEENKQRFAPFLDRIIHVVIDEYPTFFSKMRKVKTWDYEHHQREQIKQGLVDCKPDDIIILSDVDEIPDPQKILEYKDTQGAKVFKQEFFCYYINCVVNEQKTTQQVSRPEWLGSVMLPYKDIKNIRKIRTEYRDRELSKQHTVVENGGWHFSYLGGVDKVIAKIESLSHSEVNKDEYKDPERIKELIASGKDLFGRDNLQYQFVPLDKTFPQYILNNQEKYADLIYNF